MLLLLRLCQLLAPPWALRRSLMLPGSAWAASLRVLSSQTQRQDGIAGGSGSKNLADRVDACTDDEHRVVDFLSRKSPLATHEVVIERRGGLGHLCGTGQGLSTRGVDKDGEDVE
jgi:hypothetical protein